MESQKSIASSSTVPVDSGHKSTDCNNTQSHTGTNSVELVVNSLMAPPKKLDCEFEMLINMLSKLDLKDDGIRMNYKIRDIQKRFCEIITNGKEIEDCIGYINRRALMDAETSTKFAILFASHHFHNLNICQKSVRTAIFGVLEGNYINAHEMRKENPGRLYNFITMLGEYYHRSRLSDNKPIAIIGESLLELLIIEFENITYVNDLTLAKLILTQVTLNGSNLSEYHSSQLAELLYLLRRHLILEPALDSMVKALFLMTLDLFYNNFNSLDQRLENMYTKYLLDGDEFLKHKRKQNIQCIDYPDNETIICNEVQQSSSSNTIIVPANTLIKKVNAATQTSDIKDSADQRPADENINKHEQYRTEQSTKRSERSSQKDNRDDSKARSKEGHCHRPVESVGHREERLHLDSTVQKDTRASNRESSSKSHRSRHPEQREFSTNRKDRCQDQRDPNDDHCPEGRRLNSNNRHLEQHNKQQENRYLNQDLIQDNQGSNCESRHRHPDNRCLNQPQQDLNRQPHGLNEHQQGFNAQHQNLNSHHQQQQPDLNAQQQGLNEQQSGLNTHHQGLNPHQHGLNSQQPSLNPHLQVLNPHQPGLIPLQQGLNPQQQSLNQHQPGLIIQQQGLNQHQQGMIAPQQSLNAHFQNMAEANPCLIQDNRELNQGHQYVCQDNRYLEQHNRGVIYGDHQHMNQVLNRAGAVFVPDNPCTIQQHLYLNQGPPVMIQDGQYLYQAHQYPYQDNRTVNHGEQYLSQTNGTFNEGGMPVNPVVQIMPQDYQEVSQNNQYPPRGPNHQNLVSCGEHFEGHQEQHDNREIPQHPEIVNNEVVAHGNNGEQMVNVMLQPLNLKVEELKGSEDHLKDAANKENTKITAAMKLITTDWCAEVDDSPSDTGSGKTTSNSPSADREHRGDSNNRSQDEGVVMRPWTEFSPEQEHCRTEDTSSPRSDRCTRANSVSSSYQQRRVRGSQSYTPSSPRSLNSRRMNRDYYQHDTERYSTNSLPRSNRRSEKAFSECHERDRDREWDQRSYQTYNVSSQNSSDEHNKDKSYHERRSRRHTTRNRHQQREQHDDSTHQPCNSDSNVKRSEEGERERGNFSHNNHQFVPSNRYHRYREKSRERYTSSRSYAYTTPPRFKKHNQSRIYAERANFSSLRDRGRFMTGTNTSESSQQAKIQSQPQPPAQPQPQPQQSPKQSTLASPKEQKTEQKTEQSQLQQQQQQQQQQQCSGDETVEDAAYDADINESECRSKSKSSHQSKESNGEGSEKCDLQQKKDNDEQKESSAEVNRPADEEPIKKVEDAGSEAEHIERKEHEE